MKKFSKKLLLMGITILLTMNFMGCKKEIDCSMCGEVKKCDLYVSTRTNDESYICDDCIEQLKDLDMEDLYEKK